MTFTGWIVAVAIVFYVAGFISGWYVFKKAKVD